MLLKVEVKDDDLVGSDDVETLRLGLNSTAVESTYNDLEFGRAFYVEGRTR